jgi:competence protein ComEC
VAFLDVGEGNATLIRTAQGQTILVDGGPSPAALAEGLGRQLPFWQRTVDLVVLSHADEDHLLGLVDLGARYRIGQVMESGRPGGSPGYARWSAQLDAAGVPRGTAIAGQRVPLGEGAWLEVVTSGGEAGGQTAANPSGVVLRLVVGSVTFFLPGDAEAEVQRWLLASGRPVATTVLEAPHHGSRAGLDAEFLRRAAPGLAVISVGADNRFGHPAPETLEMLRGIPVYRTDVHGTVEVVTDGVEVTVLTGR